MLTAEDLVRWAAEDPLDQEALTNLNDALTAAQGYLLGAGVPDADSVLRDMALRKLAMYFYEVRAPDSRNGFPDPPPDLNALILQLRH